MSGKLLDTVVGIIRESQQYPKAVKFTGGEPLMHPDITEYIRTFADICPDRSIVTNGLLLTPDYLSRLRDNGLTRLRLGIDSLQKTKSRPSIGKWPVSPRATDIIAMVEKAGVPYELNIVLTQYNVNEILPLMLFCLANRISAKFIDLVDVVAFGDEHHQARVVSHKESMEEHFTTLIAGHFPGMIRVVDEMGEANMLYCAPEFHFRFCKHLCDYKLCHTTGTRIDPDGAVHTCMNTRGRYYLNPALDYSDNVKRIHDAVKAGCGQHM